MKKFVLLLAGCLVYVSCQSKGEDKCNGPPNVYYNFGTDGSLVQNVNPSTNIQQGRPGKSGVQGIKGQKGSIGQKGEAGTPDETTEELQIVKEKLQLLNNTDEKIQIQAMNQSRKLNEELQQMKSQFELLNNTNKEMQMFLKTQLEVVNDTVEELQIVKKQLEVANNTNKKYQVITNTQSKEINDTIEELQLMKNTFKVVREHLFLSIPSCDYLSNTTFPSGIYVISPDPFLVQPFKVTCNITGNSTETIIHHDSESEIQVSNCEPQRCYKRSIHYTASLQQIEALIQRSSQCRQFIKYRCINSVMFNINYNPPYATWLSRDGTAKFYWGGATSQRDTYCACGESGSCADNAFKCNCDINDNTDRFDEGYLTDKADLPVTGLQFGDATAPGEKGWHTLGPLICSGK